MKKTVLAIAVVSQLPCAFYSYADSSNADTMVVTANRFEQPAKSVLASTITVTKQDIAALQAHSALEVLRTLSGVEVVSSGGKAQATSIFLRGTGSKHTLMLLDGVRINSSTTGGSSIGLIPAFAIEKIEIIKGHRAAAYGSDAIGGIISITTSKDFTSEHQGRVGYGSHGHSLLGWKSVGQLNDSTHGEVIVSQEKSDGYKVLAASPDSEEDGYKAQTFVGHLQHQFNAEWQGKLTLHKADSYAKYATSNMIELKQKKTDTESELLAGLLRYAQGDFFSELQISTRYNEATDGLADDSDAKQIIRTRQNVLSWLNNSVLADVIHLQVGLEYSQDKADLLGSYSNSYDETEKHMQSVFFTSSTDVNDVTFEVSGRYDDSSTFGHHTTWNGGIGYWITDELQILGNFGTAYKEPSFNDLYWPNSGNPNLKPEDSKSRELAVKGFHELLSWELSVYRTDLQDMIDWKNVGGSVWKPSNVARARIEGIELSATVETGPIEHKLSAAWKKAEDASDGSLLDKRAQNNYSWAMLYSQNQWRGTITTNYVGNRADSSKWLGSYITVDTGVSYLWNHQTSIGIKVENLFDEDYETGYYGSANTYYKGNERTLFAEVGYQF
ncbi:TonB-dependent receptor domain-containing protein [Vibrio spartinae]|uniref:Vitamin B12 transporter BtuB n=1 Tax=Vibrio spartinae TaxID=1918945 RepID=A0A1N6MBS9_9VIBR|nr:TonB-dependent receptor [Vibrio spartinae]SIO96908.1 Vitamin B12 transporter BtuB precursor [Vibrio spartinae]